MLIVQLRCTDIEIQIMERPKGGQSVREIDNWVKVMEDKA
jgi:hypothetical protein